MSFPIDLRAPAGPRRNSTGPDACPAAVGSADAVDERGWERVVSADFDMGAWFDARTPSPDTETRCI